jgi:hypothetical protein
MVSGRSKGTPNLDTVEITDTNAVGLTVLLPGRSGEPRLASQAKYLPRPLACGESPVGAGCARRRSRSPRQSRNGAKGICALPHLEGQWCTARRIPRTRANHRPPDSRRHDTGQVRPIISSACLCLPRIRKDPNGSSLPSKKQASILRGARLFIKRY